MVAALRDEELERWLYASEEVIHAHESWPGCLTPNQPAAVRPRVHRRFRAWVWFDLTHRIEVSSAERHPGDAAA